MNAGTLPCAYIHKGGVPETRQICAPNQRGVGNLDNRKVHGLIRRASTFHTDRIDHLYQDPHESDAKLFLHYADLADGTGLRRVLERVQPDEVYNLAAQSHVMVSFEQPEYTADVVATGTLRLLEALREKSL